MGQGIISRIQGAAPARGCQTLAAVPRGDYGPDVTQLLERAFAAASRLPAAEQDAVASVVLAELESERRWAESFAGNQEQLAVLADEALREFEAGETRPMDLRRDFPND